MNKTAAPARSLTAPSWRPSTAPRGARTQTVFAVESNGLLQQNLPKPALSRRSNARGMMAVLAARLYWREGRRSVFDRLGRVEHKVLPETCADELHPLRQSVVTTDGHCA